MIQAARPPTPTPRPPGPSSRIQGMRRLCTGAGEGRRPETARGHRQRAAGGGRSIQRPHRVSPEVAALPPLPPSPRPPPPAPPVPRGTDSELHPRSAHCYLHRTPPPQGVRYVKTRQSQLTSRITHHPRRDWAANVSKFI